MSNPITSRRSFLKITTLFTTGLLIGLYVPEAQGRNKTLKIGTEPISFAPNAYLRISPESRIEILLSHVEMGQGIWTTLPMLIAEELDLDWKNIDIRHAPPGDPYIHTAFGVQITGGSSTTWSEFDRYRKAGATAREMLIYAASKRWQVSTESCTTESGYVISGNKKLSYGELATEAALSPVPKNIVLRDPSQWKFIGKGVKRLDGPCKVNGTAKFGMDMQDAGLLTALVAHSPVAWGKVKSFDAKKTLNVPGVRQVVEIPTGVAVLADHYWAAKKGRDVLEVIWDPGEGINLDTGRQTVKYSALAKTNGMPAVQQGDPNAVLEKAFKVLEAEYVFPYLAHAPMEPLNCTVRLSSEKCEIWTGTQLPGIDQAATARLTGLKPSQVEINTVFLGGGFGRRAALSSDFVVEAVQIAKASGKYIKLVWSREDDIKGGSYRSSFVHRVKAGLDTAGEPVAWLHNIVGQSIMHGTFMQETVKNGIDGTSIEGVEGSPYLKAVANQFIGLHTTVEPVAVLWFRSVGHSHTAFVMETMIDELAYIAQQNPFNYRRMLLKEHPRHLAALNLVAEKSNWFDTAPKDRYRGIAVHEAFGSFVAQVIEISITNGVPKVHKVTCAIDCGLAVNPDGVKAQMESGIIFGLTMALYGEIGYKDGEVIQSNFYDYKILRMHESPVIDVHIVDSKEKMGGAGECAVPQVAPALVNAIFAATGKRIRQLPIIKNIS